MRAAIDGFRDAAAMADRIAIDLKAGRPSAAIPVHLQSNGAEILFADDVPLVPTICPVVVLEGSDFDMGRQYARQIIEIYGPWGFAQQAGCFQVGRRNADPEGRHAAARTVAMPSSSRVRRILSSASPVSGSTGSRGMPAGWPIRFNAALKAAGQVPIPISI